MLLKGVEKAADSPSCNNLQKFQFCTTHILSEWRKQIQQTSKQPLWVIRDNTFFLKLKKKKKHYQVRYYSGEVTVNGSEKGKHVYIEI